MPVLDDDDRLNPLGHSVIHHAGEHTKGTGWEKDGYTVEGWYFWDETGAWRYGPYTSREQACDAARLYGARLIGDDD